MQKTGFKAQNNKAIFRAIVFTIALIFLILSLYFYNIMTPKNVKNIETNTAQSQITNKKSSQITEFEISIPTLDVNAPVIPNVDGTNKDEYLLALTKGVAHYEGTGLPGYGRNIFIFGHSSSPDSTKGSYDNIFSKINNLKLNDEIILNFNNDTFIYLVDNKKIIKPDDSSVLNSSEFEQVTLMACWPIGNNTERIIVTAKRK